MISLFILNIRYIFCNAQCRAGIFKQFNNMKAILSSGAADVNGPDLNFGLYDNSNNFVAPFTITPTLGSQMTPTTAGATLLATLESLVVSGAAGLGYTITASDIVWNGYCPYNKSEQAAFAAASQAPSYSTPTFSGSTAATKLSATRDAAVSYDYDATIAISVLAGQSITATLKYADDSGMTTNVVTVSSQIASNSGVLGLSQTNTLKVAGRIPANKYRQVTFSVTGSATAPSTLKAGQEVLL